jgi:Predicted phosphohydrolases
MNLEARMLRVEKIRITDKNNSIKIAQLSDIHIGYMFVSPEKINKALVKEDPDVIILTGDYIENESQIPKFLEFLDQLPDKPTFAIFGNHDHKAFLKNPRGLADFHEKIEDKGIVMLINRNSVQSIKGRTLNLVGIEDMRYKKHDIKGAFSGIDDTETTLAFSHNPDIIFSLGKNKPDLLLAGHFHGGQMWAPFHIEFKLLRKERLSKMKIYRGLNTVNKQKLYISRGLGNVVFPFRFLSIPEITIFEI